MNEENTYLVGKRFPNRLFVGGLSPTVSATELAAYFSRFTDVVDAKVICDETGISKGYGFVTFKSIVDVKKVWQMGTLFLRNKKLNIGPAVKKEGPQVTPEYVIVPRAPSKGEYYYPCSTPVVPQIQAGPVYTMPDTYYYPTNMMPMSTELNMTSQYSYYYSTPNLMEAPSNNYVTTYIAPPNEIYNTEMKTCGVERNTKKSRRMNLAPRFKTKRSH